MRLACSFAIVLTLAGCSKSAHDRLEINSELVLLVNQSGTWLRDQAVFAVYESGMFVVSTTDESMHRCVELTAKQRSELDAILGSEEFARLPHGVVQQPQMSDAAIHRVITSKRQVGVYGGVFAVSKTNPMVLTQLARLLSEVAGSDKARSCSVGSWDVRARRGTEPTGEWPSSWPDPPDGRPVSRPGVSGEAYHFERPASDTKRVKELRAKTLNWKGEAWRVHARYRLPGSERFEKQSRPQNESEQP